MTNEKSDTSPANQLRLRAEKLYEQTVDETEIIPADKVLLLIEELKIHQIELELQNEELRQTQLELEETRDRYLNLYDFAPTAYLTLDPKGIILEANLTFNRLLGVERRNVLQKPFFRFIVPDHQDLYYLHQKHCFEELIQLSCELRLLKQDSTHLWGRLDSVVVYDTNGGNNQLRIALTDITEQKQAEENRLQLEHQLRQSQKLESIGILAGGIAHEFNNLLTPILGYAGMLAHQHPEGSSTKLKLERIKQAGERAKTLVQQLLAFARQSMESREPVQLATIVEEALGLLEHTLPSTISIERKIDPGLPKIEANAREIHQVIVNLCLNAHQAMPEGGKLTLQLKQGKPDQCSHFVGKTIEGPFVTLVVRDTGVGMDSTVIEHIFDPFYTTKEVGEGTGLGLSVVLGIVEQYGGHVEVKSKVRSSDPVWTTQATDSTSPGGTTFEICFPVMEIKKKIIVESHVDLSLQGNERILLVDDESTLTKVITELLENLGYRVTPFISAVDALTGFCEQPQSFDLVMTDYTMPQMTGKRLAELIREVRSDIPIILSTGYSDAVTPEKIHIWGINALLMKPYNQQNLSETVRQVLEKKVES